MRPDSNGPRTKLVAILLSGILALGGATTILGAAGDDGDDSADAAASSPGSPYGVHLSFTDDPETTTTVTWFTEGVSVGDPHVLHGSARDDITQRVDAYASTKVPRVDVMAHEATITGLSPGEEVFYKACGTAGCDAVASFTTDDGDDEVRIVMFGDNDFQSATDTSPAPESVMEKTIELEPDLVLITGDLSYAEEDHAEWDEWYELRKPLFNNTHMMASPGNHEIVGGKAAFNNYLIRNAFPGEEAYYSFEYGNVHITSFVSDRTTQATYGYNQNMSLFMEEDLAAAQQAKEEGTIDHVMVFQHHPLYSNEEGADRWVTPTIVAQEEHLLHRYDVKFLLAGHNHHYERSYPMSYQVPTTFEDEHYVDPVGWIQVINGGGGQSLYGFKHPDDFLPYAADHAKAYNVVLMQTNGDTVEVQSWGAGLYEAFQPHEGTPGLIDTFKVTDTTGPTSQPSANLGGPTLR